MGPPLRRLVTRVGRGSASTSAHFRNVPREDEFDVFGVDSATVYGAVSNLRLRLRPNDLVSEVHFTLITGNSADRSTHRVVLSHPEMVARAARLADGATVLVRGQLQPGVERGRLSLSIATNSPDSFLHVVKESPESAPPIVPLLSSGLPAWCPAVPDPQCFEQEDFVPGLLETLSISPETASRSAAALARAVVAHRSSSQSSLERSTRSGAREPPNLSTEGASLPPPPPSNLSSGQAGESFQESRRLLPAFAGDQAAGALDRLVSKVAAMKDFLSPEDLSSFFSAVLPLGLDAAAVSWAWQSVLAAEEAAVGPTAGPLTPELLDNVVAAFLAASRRPVGCLSVEAVPESSNTEPAISTKVCVDDTQFACLISMLTIAFLHGVAPSGLSLQRLRTFFLPADEAAATAGATVRIFQRFLKSIPPSPRRSAQASVAAFLLGFHGAAAAIVTPLRPNPWHGCGEEAVAMVQGVAVNEALQVALADIFASLEWKMLLLGEAAGSPGQAAERWESLAVAV